MLSNWRVYLTLPGLKTALRLTHTPSVTSRIRIVLGVNSVLICMWLQVGTMEKQTGNLGSSPLHNTTVFQEKCAAPVLFLIRKKGSQRKLLLTTMGKDWVTPGNCFWITCDHALWQLPSMAQLDFGHVGQLMLVAPFGHNWALQSLKGQKDIIQDCFSTSTSSPNMITWLGWRLIVTAAGDSLIGNAIHSFHKRQICWQLTV